MSEILISCCLSTASCWKTSNCLMDKDICSKFIKSVLIYKCTLLFRGVLSAAPNPLWNLTLERHMAVCAMCVSMAINSYLCSWFLLAIRIVDFIDLINFASKFNVNVVIWRWAARRRPIIHRILLSFKFISETRLKVILANVRSCSCGGGELRVILLLLLLLFDEVEDRWTINAV